MFQVFSTNHHEGESSCCRQTVADALTVIQDVDGICRELMIYRPGSLGDDAVISRRTS